MRQQRHNSLSALRGRLPATDRRRAGIPVNNPASRRRATTYLTRVGLSCRRGLSIRKYFRINRPSRPFSGAPQ
jgi:hypothetical protein